jgi:Bardet-Biedl syndrome 9 protein
MPSTGSYVSFADNLPLQEFLSLGDLHLETRLALEANLSSLNDAAHQFRLIEKRLLVRFKDKSPTPLAGLDILMKESYARLVHLSDTVSAGQLQLQNIGSNLCSMCQLMYHLTCMKFSFIAEERDALKLFLCIDERVCQGIGGTAEQGWEETIDANMSFLLKTCLAKSTKDTATLPENALVMPRDTSNVNKHIAMVLDRFAKGGRPIIAVPAASSSSSSSSSPSR